MASQHATGASGHPAECAICFDDLGVARTTLACNHSFHLRCIAGWFYQQNMSSDMDEGEVQEGKTVSTCPCCRAKPEEKEDIPFSNWVTFIDPEDLEEDEEGSEDGDEEDEDEEDAEPDEVAQLLAGAAEALRVSWVRTGEGRWERVVNAAGAPPAPEEPAVWDGEVDRVSPPPDSLTDQLTVAARKIQAVWRGHVIRCVYRGGGAVAPHVSHFSMTNPMHEP